MLEPKQLWDSKGTILLSEVDVESFLRYAMLCPVLGCDFESNGQDVRDGRGYTQGVSLAYSFSATEVPTSHYFPFRHQFGFNYGPDVVEQLRALFSARGAAGLATVWHNAKGDLHSAENAGFDLGNYYCTMMMATAIREEYPFSKSLEECSKHYLKDDGKKMTPELLSLIKRFGWGAVPSEMMYGYAAHDAALTLRLFYALKDRWDREGLDSTYWPNKRGTIRVVNTMERRGIRVDVELCSKLAAIGQMQMDEVRELLQLNPASTKDLKVLLLDVLKLPIVKTTDKGNPSFDKEAMKIYDQILERRSGDATADYIKTFRGWQKAVSSCYVPYQELLSPDGRLRCNYKLHSTKTGRFSCEVPNLQQIPKTSDKPWNGDVKRAFIARDGYTLFEADYSQLELRLGTAYGRDPELLEEFANPDGDIFQEMSRALGMSRQDTKTFVYSVQYGAGLKRISDVFGVDASRASQMRNDYYSAYPGFRKATNLAAATTKAQGRVKLWSGRYRHFDYPANSAHKAFNSVCQGGGADIMEATMRRLFDEVDNEQDCRMLLQVHDSIVFEIKDSVADTVLPEIKRIMEDVDGSTGFNFGVRFAVDCHRWRD